MSLYLGICIFIFVVFLVQVALAMLAGHYYDVYMASFRNESYDYSTLTLYVYLVIARYGYWALLLLLALIFTVVCLGFFIVTIRKAKMKKSSAESASEVTTLIAKVSLHHHYPPQAVTVTNISGHRPNGQ